MPCPVPNCRARRPADKALCRGHYYALSEFDRRELARALRRGHEVAAPVIRRLSRQLARAEARSTERPVVDGRARASGERDDEQLELFGRAAS